MDACSCITILKVRSDRNRGHVRFHHNIDSHSRNSRSQICFLRISLLYWMRLMSTHTLSAPLARFLQSRTSLLAILRAAVSFRCVNLHINLQASHQYQSSTTIHMKAFRYYCQKCNTLTKENTKHCNICNICIYSYDHHCVFIGKCVGGNNMGRFKLFLFMIFSTLIYGLVSALFNLQNIR